MCHLNTNPGKVVQSVIQMNTERDTLVDGIPMPIVRLNRGVIVAAVALAIALQAPLFTTALFLIITPAALKGRRYSLIYALGSRLFAKQNATAEREDWRLQRFNNSIAAVMLGLAQIAFFFGLATLGYTLSAMVATAALVALLGFCVGCFIYYQFNLNKRRVFGS